MYSVYILECKDGSLYTGISTDVDRRFRQHENGTGGSYTRSHGAKRMIYVGACADRSSALKREAAIKRLNRKQKLELAAGSV